MRPLQNKIYLSRTVTLDKYLQLEKKQNRNAIAAFIKERFTERYITPLESVKPRQKNGFCIMAVCCLLIETLESFRQGWIDSRGKTSKKAFKLFFGKSDAFGGVQPFAVSFYKNVRCGILHQGETRGGWLIRRKGQLFDSESLTINASRFLAELKTYLENYCDHLNRSDWDSVAWRNVRRKMDAICKGCYKSAV